MGSLIFLLVVIRIAWRAWGGRSGMIAAVDVYWGTTILGCCGRVYSGSACTDARTFPVLVFFWFCSLVRVLDFVWPSPRFVIAPPPVMRGSRGGAFERHCGRVGAPFSQQITFRGSLDTSVRTVRMYMTLEKSVVPGVWQR